MGHLRLPAIELTGCDLDAAALALIARHNRPVAIEAVAQQRLVASRAVVDSKLESGEAVYGLTTGLGPRVGHRLEQDDLAAFSRRTLLGRANAVGPPLPRDQVRAIMTVRLNALLKGGAGVSPPVAHTLANMLNHGLHPRLPSIGSVGASDLSILAHLGLSLIGEGRIERDGREHPATEALRAAGLEPIRLGPKDGLAICSASAMSAGIAGLVLHDIGVLWRLAQLAAAMTFEAFRANLTPLDPRAAAARPAPGQVESAAHLCALLAGSDLAKPGTARRLQDPISLRAVAPVHGALLAAIRFLQPAADAEMNGAGDNPLVLTSDNSILSTGNFHTPALGLALEILTQAIAQVAALSVSRAARLLTGRLTGLPDSLSPRDAGHSGLGPFHKTSETLLQEIRHLSLPAVPDLRWAADGIEDDITNTPLAAKKAASSITLLRLVIAAELVVAAQAVEMRAPENLAPSVAKTLSAVRGLVPALDDDRPMGDELALVAEKLLNEDLLITADAPSLP